MKKYKIAICYDFANYVGGGVGRATFELANELIRLGHEVTVIYKVGDHSKDLKINSYKLFLIRGPFINSLYYSLMLPKIVKKLNPDLVITQCNTAPLLGKLSKPHLHIIHSLQREEIKYTKIDIKSILEFPLLFLLEYFNIRKSDKILAVNEHISNEIYKKYGILSQIIEWGIDLSKFRPSKTINKNPIPKIISVTSKNNERKNLKLLINVCSQLNIELRLTNYPYKKLPKNVKDLGYISESRLVTELQHSDIFVLPSLQESFGIATLEALSCNVPVVITNTGIYEKVIKYNAGEVVENSYSSLRNGIITAISKKYGNNPRKLALQYSWKHCANTVIKLFKSISVKTTT